MVIGIISDTHDRLAAVDASFRLFCSKNIDMVIHCGDWKSLDAMRHFAEVADSLNLPVVGVLGNNDLEDGMDIFAKHAPGIFAASHGVVELEINRKTIAIYHGYHKPTLRQLRANRKYDLVLLGHTHKPLIESFDRTIIINPGSIAFSIPRSKAWKPTVATINLESMHAVIETVQID